jgi:hypothetical protein
MKKYLPYLATILLVSMISCKKEEVEKPKVIYEDAPKTKPMEIVDTTQIEVADLPIALEGTSYLIHPIGQLNREGKALKSSTDSEEGFTVSNYGEYQITGYLKNLKFQEIGKDSLTILTSKPVLIETVTYLKALADKTKQQILVYTLSDIDTNKDGKLNGDDIKSLYISTISGSKFTKLSADYQELVDWKMIESLHLLYFRTIEDTNKNGAFDAKDQMQYQYVNLKDGRWTVMAYHPIP